MGDIWTRADVCIDCRSTNVEGPDHEGFIDCFDCGAAFIPGVAIDTNGESDV